MINLRKVDKSNYTDVINLQLNENDQKMVNSNLYSMEESIRNSNMIPRAIYNDELLVGFLMYEYIVNDAYVEIHRLMIDRRYQRKGYGRKAMKLALHEIKKLPGVKECYISYEIENFKAIPLYESLGFVETGELNFDEGTNNKEVMAKLEF